MRLPWFVSIPVAQIAPSPFQVHKRFAPAQIRSLANSLLEIGLSSLILVRLMPSGSEGGGDAVHYELASGECRARAGTLLGLKGDSGEGGETL